MGRLRSWGQLLCVVGLDLDASQKIFNNIDCPGNSGLIWVFI